MISASWRRRTVHITVKRGDQIVTVGVGAFDAWVEAARCSLGISQCGSLTSARTAARRSSYVDMLLSVNGKECYRQASSWSMRSRRQRSGEAGFTVDRDGEAEDDPALVNPDGGTTPTSGSMCRRGFWGSSRKQNWTRRLWVKSMQNRSAALRWCISPQSGTSTCKGTSAARS